MGWGGECCVKLFGISIPCILSYSSRLTALETGRTRIHPGTLCYFRGFLQSLTQIRNLHNYGRVTRKANQNVSPAVNNILTQRMTPTLISIKWLAF